MKRTGAWFEIGVGIIVIALGAGMMMSDRNKRESLASEIASMPPRERNLAVFDAATALLQTHYYDSKFFTTFAWRELDARWRNKAAGSEPPLLYANVLDNLADEFPESHVAFVPPRRGEAARGSGAIEDYEWLSRPGFHAPEIRRPQGRVTVIDDVLAGSPAERAGVTPGWVLIESKVHVINDHSLYTGAFLDMDAQASRAIETTGRLTQADDFMAAHTVKVEFEPEEPPSSTDFETRQLPGGVTYLRFDVFDDLDLVEKVLDIIEGAGTAGLILDLRRNPGGRQLHLQRVAGALLGKGTNLGTSRTADANAPMASWRFADHYRGPLVVLIGPRTASAAEITAAAIQDQGRGKLIGRTTNGSVVPGQWFDLPDGGKMMIPVSDFVRINGRRIEGAGVEPDIWILPTLDDVRAGRDPTLERAVEELRFGTIS